MCQLSTAGHSPTLIYKQKLLYWKRVAGLDGENWANRAFEECKGAVSKTKGGAWNSLWYKEIFSIFIRCKIIDIFGKHTKMDESIRRWVDSWEESQNEESLKGTSLKYLPEYKTSTVPQNYVNHSLGSKTLAKFRLGDARLVEHGLGEYKMCPVCNRKGVKFMEAHFTFECNGLEETRTKWSSLISNFDASIGGNNLLLKMKEFLGQDGAMPNELEKRGMYLDKLVTAWEKILAK